LAWVACHLFVHAEDPRDVYDGLLEILRPPPHADEASPGGDDPSPLTITPAIDGWVAVTGISHWVQDVEHAARRLSAACTTHVISVELYAQVFRLRIAEHRSGQSGSSVRTPDHGWAEDRAATYHGPMPLYEDVEQRAYRTLRGLGLPALSITLGTRPYGAAPQSHPIGDGRLVRGPRPSLHSESVSLVAAPPPCDEAPVIAQRAAGQLGGSLFDVRYVEGVPSAAAVERLIALESAVEARARRADPAGRVNLTVTYHAGIHQQRLDELLRERGRHVPPSARRATAPWWQFWRYFGTFSRKG
jgi:hypothetical protein